MKRDDQGDIVFGGYDGWRLAIRPLASLWFCRYMPHATPGRRFRVSLARLLWPRNWWHAARDNGAWRCSARWEHGTPRCYCQGGRTLELTLAAFGFGAIVTISRWRGELPCPCDRALDELISDDARQSRHAHTTRPDGV